MISLSFESPYVLILSILAVLPLFSRNADFLPYPSVSELAQDFLSLWLERCLRLIGALSILAIVMGLAGLHKPQLAVPKIAKGAHIVLLLDRSRSMDQPFATKNKIRSVSQLWTEDSKITVARRVLKDFVANREHDLVGMMFFSSLPIPVVGLTGNHGIIQASIESSEIGRGLAQTNLGGGLESAIRLFDNKPYSGSRIIILVSDGAAQLDGIVKRSIRELLKVNRVTVYWMYMRSATGSIILGENAKPSPELALHRFFQSTETPYRAYMAEEPDDLERAVKDIDRLQNTPLHYEEKLPKEDYSPYCFLSALILTSVLFIVSLFRAKRWGEL